LIVGFMPESISGLESIEATAIPMRIAAGASLIMGFYCLLLPHTPPKLSGEKVTVSDVLCLKALKLLKDPPFAVFTICSLLICIPLAFYYQSANGFLGEIGIKNAAGKMTMGQMSEIFFMLVMPFFFIRLGIKKMLLVGMIAWVIRYFLFAFGSPSASDGSVLLPVAFIYIGILLHGICYDFFFVTGQIYVDKKAPKDIQASAQGFLALVTLGLGMIIGNLINGWVVNTKYAIEEAGEVVGHHWKPIWMIPAVMAMIITVVFALSFREKLNSQPTEKTIE